MKYISAVVLPIVVTGIIIYGLKQREKVFDIFLNGAKQGIEVSIKIIPSIIGIMVAIGVFKASGALEIY
jgi:spore maturation protein B